MKSLRQFSALVSILMLCACSTVKPMQPVDASSAVSMSEALEMRADEYQNASAKWGGTEAWNNVPLIALGAGGVAASAFATGVAKGNWVIGLALAAGVWALGYSTLAPDTKQDAYSTAATQLTCLAEKSRPLDDSPNSRLATQTAQLGIGLKSLTSDIGFARATRAGLPAALSANDQNMVAAADGHVVQAQSVLDRGNAELDARNSIPVTLKSLLYAIDRKAQISARSKVLTVSDVTAALASAKGVSGGEGGTAGAAPTGGGFTFVQRPVAGVDKPNGPVQQYAAAANKLIKSASLVDNNPIVDKRTYTGALASFATCTSEK